MHRSWGQTIKPPQRYKKGVIKTEYGGGEFSGGAA